MNNYEISRNKAQQYFLGFDQKKLLEIWQLPADETYLYVDFLGQTYRICRATGAVSRLLDAAEADYEETLSVFDLLCHAGNEKWVTGRFAPVNSLRGNAAVGVTVDFHKAFAQKADEQPELFRKACEDAGGIPVHLGDIGFRFPVFAQLDVILKFYHSDEDFPATLTLLWDENMLQFVYYETVFYIAGALLKRINTYMERR